MVSALSQGAHGALRAHSSTDCVPLKTSLSLLLKKMSRKTVAGRRHSLDDQLHTEVNRTRLEKNQSTTESSQPRSNNSDQSTSGVSLANSYGHVIVCERVDLDEGEIFRLKFVFTFGKKKQQRVD
jgi:hypothetical protein